MPNERSIPVGPMPVYVDELLYDLCDEYGIRFPDTVNLLKYTPLGRSQVITHNNGKVEYVPYGASKPRVSSWAKWFAYINKLITSQSPFVTPELYNTHIVNTIPTGDIQTYQSFLSSRYTTDGLDFRILNGVDVEYIYDTVADSCMSGSTAVQLYVENPDKVSVLVVSRHGEDIARALVWTLDGDAEAKFVDRIYPSDGGAHIRYVQAVARDAGWYYKLQQSVHGDNTAPEHMMVTLKDVGHYPYMDTMSYAQRTDDGRLILANNSACFKGHTDWEMLTNTDDIDPWEEKIIGQDIDGNDVYESEEDEYQWNFNGEYLVHYLDSSEALNTGEVAYHGREPRWWREVVGGDVGFVNTREDEGSYRELRWSDNPDNIGLYAFCEDCIFDEELDGYVLKEEWDAWIEYKREEYDEQDN